MLYIYTRMLTLKNDTNGATAVEYGILVAAIAALIIVAVGLIGSQLDTKFVAVCTALGASSTDCLA